MPFYASQFEGVGTEDDPFRPLAAGIAEADGVEWRAIDLRANPTTVNGWAIVWAPSLLSSTPTGVVLLAATPNSPLTAQARNGIQSRLGVTVPDGYTFRQLMRRLLREEARTDGTRWAPLRAAKDGRFRIHLGDASDEWTE